MKYSFTKNLKDLPSSIPLFPLNKVLLLPRAKLPLNLFENRYLHMFDHALENGRFVGMIQPSDKIKSNSDIKNPELYSVGCAGYITAFSQTNDNRYEIILYGTCRFKIKQETETDNGFRMASVDWKDYSKDFEVEKLKSTEYREEFLKLLKPFLDKLSMNVDWEMIDGMSDEDLINTISMCCPFDVNEKQALLEAKNLESRFEILKSLIQMSLNINKFSDSRYVS